MQENLKTTPKDFFFQIGSIIGLYVSAGSLIALLYQLIDYAFPDNLAYYGDPYSAGIKFAIASLIVIFPLYLYLGRTLQKDFSLNPEKRNLAIRKWLVYFTLFVATIVIVGDLIALINTFLGGEITTRFILKVLAVFVVAGLVFGYYLSDIRRPENTARNIKIFGAGASLLVIASIVLGFVVMGSPTTQRKLRFDSMRVSHLEQIQWQTINYWQNKGKLPETLKDLEDPISGFVAPVDPMTEKPYEYKVLDKEKFELCATFELPTPDLKGRGPTGSRDVYYSDGIVSGDNWKHEAGEQCFERTIDKDLYPIDKVPVRY